MMRKKPDPEPTNQAQFGASVMDARLLEQMGRIGAEDHVRRKAPAAVLRWVAAAVAFLALGTGLAALSSARQAQRMADQAALTLLPISADIARIEEVLGRMKEIDQRFASEIQSLKEQRPRGTTGVVDLQRDYAFRQLQLQQEQNSIELDRIALELRRQHER